MWSLDGSGPSQYRCNAIAWSYNYIVGRRIFHCKSELRKHVPNIVPHKRQLNRVYERYPAFPLSTPATPMAVLIYAVSWSIISTRMTHTTPALALLSEFIVKLLLANDHSLTWFLTNSQMKHICRRDLKCVFFCTYFLYIPETTVDDKAWWIHCRTSFHVKVISYPCPNLNAG